MDSSMSIASPNSGTNNRSDGSCSLCLCRENVIGISDCEELRSIKNHIELCSNVAFKLLREIIYDKNVERGQETLAIMKQSLIFACQECLFKLYAVVQEVKAKDHDACRRIRLDAIRKLIMATGGILPPRTPSTSSGSSSGSYSVIPDEEIFQREFSVGRDIALDSSGNCDSDEESAVKANGDREIELENGDHSNHRIETVPDLSLDVMYELPESALDTESGGNPDQYKPAPLRCNYCPKTFVHQKRFNRHLRTHKKEVASVRSASVSRGRATPSNIVYKCDDCPTTFTTAQMLRKHSKIHLRHYGCEHCHLHFFTARERDFHEAECYGKMMAKSSEKRCSTRSVTRSLARSQCNTSIKPKVSTTKSTAQSSRRTYSKKGRTSVGYDDEDDEDEVSVACTDNYSLVQSWVNKTYHIKKLIPAEIDDIPVTIVSQQEYDLVMLARLIEESERNVYTCNFIDCDYVTNTLRDMSLHEVAIHKAKTYFYCKKCSGVFTSKLFLDYHLYNQNFGEYHCHKCSMTFIYEYKLDHHLIQHQTHDPHPCLQCDCSFMSEQELRIHTIETGHNPNKRKNIITIDRTMTITNKTKPEPPPKKRVYRCTEKILRLPKIPTKRPMQINWPKYTKIFLGDLDFSYEPGRNCARTQ